MRARDLPGALVRQSSASRDWASLAAMQADAVRWCAEVAAQRRPRALEGRTVAEVFAAEEAPALGPLPATPFEIASWSRPKVAPDAHAKAERQQGEVTIGRHVGGGAADDGEIDRTVTQLRPMMSEIKGDRTIYSHSTCLGASIAPERSVVRCSIR